MAETHEYIVNLHMHTRYSDGSGTHQDIARAALETGVDAVIVTDHNVLVQDKEGYVSNGKRKTLVLVGEEIHDQARQPQKSHLLAFNAQREMAIFAYDPQTLINNIQKAGGLSFIAHPKDPACPAIKEVDISWEDWQVQGYTGLELWNGLSELKSVSHTILHAFFYVYFPHLIASQPYPEVLAKWDELLGQGRKVAAIGGSDAHAIPVSLGPLHREVFPYTFHFRAINTHIFLPQPLTGRLESDREAIYQALGAGHAFVGYDLPAPTKGFRFTGQNREQIAWMGDEISAESGITFKIHLPQPAECVLLKDGIPRRKWEKRQSCSYTATEPGVYRVESYKRYLGKRRGWIYSNPIYVRAS
jgi:hypothetical protein